MYEVVLHVGAQLDHVVEVHTIHAHIMAVSHVLDLGTNPKKQLQFIVVAKSLLNDVANGESVPRCVNMFRSASPFHPGLCRVLHLLLHPQPPLSDLCSWHLIKFVEAGHHVRADFDKLEIKDEVRPLILKDNAVAALGLTASGSGGAAT